MFENKTVAVVIPCYNEQRQIGRVLDTMPDFVDLVIVVDDASTDDTAGVVRQCAAESRSNGSVVLLRHEDNRGPGAATRTGYEEAIRRRMEVVAVMNGDGQMAARQLRLLVRPVVRGEADYAKVNRLYYRRAWNLMPRHRYLGNAFLSMATKVASGYWHVADSQTGYTAISLPALRMVELDQLYPRYGYPNDMLVRLNVYDFRVVDVPVRPVYGVGERSNMRMHKVVPRMTWLILRLFLWRMWRKYVVHDFHPLVLFYLASLLLGVMGLALFVRLIWVWAQTAHIPPMNALAWVFCTIAATQFGLFAMWFDMERNRHVRQEPGDRKDEE